MSHARAASSTATEPSHVIFGGNQQGAAELQAVASALKIMMPARSAYTTCKGGHQQQHRSQEADDLQKLFSTSVSGYIRTVRACSINEQIHGDY